MDYNTFSSDEIHRFPRVWWDPAKGKLLCNSSYEACIQLLCDSSSKQWDVIRLLKDRFCQIKYTPSPFQFADRQFVHEGGVILFNLQYNVKHSLMPRCEGCKHVFGKFCTEITDYHIISLLELAIKNENWCDGLLLLNTMRDVILNNDEVEHECVTTRDGGSLQL